MRAISQNEFGGPEVLQEVDVPRPEPLPTEVLVRVVSAGVNPVDAKTRAGGGMAGVLGEPPFILGWDVSGVVETVGFGVHTLKPGDEVYGMPWFPRQAGGFAEYVTAPSRHFALKPSTVDHDAAAAVPLAALTAWQILHDAVPIKAGQRVLIHAAAGGVGHFAVQFAKAAGAHVTGTASAGKHDWLREIGADEGIDYRTVRFEDVTGDQDVVVDLIGGDNAIRSTRVLKPGGIVVAVPGGVSDELATAAGSRGVTAIPFLVEPDGHALAEIARLVDAGQVRVEVEQVFPFDEVRAAHERQESGRAQGKLVVRIGT
ncbi:NADP-dependent oxidoreductase [Kibdelosporangium phytohabitans]|uniref:NADPH:quinone reductase n=1 Tax=Kibdelosporangium phytohabitans TaxID=860235 RepID=A0A0N9HP61_9PSEU|nr:NADP-dependent oxidoreductase [Kibdelosporangium phytohabitans]ALG06149.1 NADPH:quinone reductase [Kibdelosporangium phytohabitans]MBE1465758.1 NADPH:quinone reductase-like Zn-dependent oxidoreductase [Kibdelosporangium phytohabitans]